MSLALGCILIFALGAIFGAALVFWRIGGFDKR